MPERADLTTGIGALRSAERSYLESGDERCLTEVGALLDAKLATALFTPATRVWLALLRYDRTGADGLLNAAIETCGSEGWQAPVAVPALLRAWARDGRAADIDRAIDYGQSEAARVAAGPRPLWLAPAWRAIDLAGAYLERYRMRSAEADLRLAREISLGAVREATEPMIRLLGQRHVAACEQELYLLHGSRRLLDQAIRRYRRALASAPESALVRPVLLTELGTALQDRYAEDGEPADIAEAVAIGEEAAAVGGGPDLTCHLVNLGSARFTRYQDEGDPDDLYEAVRRWEAALAGLPSASPDRPAFCDRLAIGLCARWERDRADEGDLDAAIDHGRVAASAGADMAEGAVYAANLAGLLIERWDLRRDPGDLNEAVRMFTEAVDRRGIDAAKAADLTANLAHTILGRYSELGGPVDVDTALKLLGRIDPLRLGRNQRATVAACRSRALFMRYEATGEQADLAAAIAAARTGLVGVDASQAVAGPRLSLLSAQLFARFLSAGRRRDLDQAIRLLYGLGEHVGPAASADQLSQLSAFLDERYHHAGDSADLTEAIRIGRLARQADYRASEPTLESNLATVLHGRFRFEGWFGELDEAIDRNRRAVAGQNDGAPTYRVLLSNLATTLEDRDTFVGDQAALDEAIELRERALALSTPGSPGHPGYLSSLASALQHRFERAGRPDDLDCAIARHEQSLAALGPGSPERADVLHDLALAHYLKAGLTSDLTEYDRAVVTMRSALSKSARNRSARPRMLLGYARMLAGQHDLLREQRLPARGRAKVIRVFQRAITSSAQSPVTRFEAADALGAWASKAGLWHQAAQAYQTAASARRELAGTQFERTHRDAWLVRGEDIAAASALAMVNCGQPELALLALDDGRAVELSVAIDERSIPSRLRAVGQGELADRYELAATRLRTASRLTK